MTARGRLLRTLDGEIPDRVPITAWLDQIFLTTYLGREIDLIVDSIDTYRNFGLDLVLRIYWAEVETWSTDQWSLTTQGCRRRPCTGMTAPMMATLDGDIEVIGQAR